MKKTIRVLIMAAMLSGAIYGQAPTIGAQIWIERGQPAAEIEGWFRTLAELNMPLTRLFLMWDVIETERDCWDFSLYDQAFAAAQRYGVRVVATLSPTHAPIFRGGAAATQHDEMPESWQMLEQQRLYIEKVVRHYKDHPALYAWMQQNEPGRAHNTGDLTMDRFRDWLQKKYGSVETLNRAWHYDLKTFAEVQYDSKRQEYGWGYPDVWYDWRTFGQEHLTWYMQWIADEIRRYDAKTPLHLNPHGLVGNLINANYELHRWRPMLQSLGASIHVAWHFGMLERIQYTMGVSYVCDLIRGASEPHPFWVTELQGGNNIYSGVRPHCPTPEDVAQWVWTSVGAGAENIIFWLLNWRARGNESGEWTMLDFQGKPTARLREAGKIATLFDQHRSFLAGAKPRLPQITIIYSYRTMMQQARTRADYSGVGRDTNAHVMAVLGFYKALNDLGLAAQLKEIDDFDWNGEKNHLAIVPHVTMLSREQAGRMATFADRGNLLLITGLTALYDETETAQAPTDFSLAPMLGARIKEIRVTGFDRTTVTVDSFELPAHIWLTTILNEGAKTIGEQGGEVVAVRSARGNVIWLPSPVGMGAWLYDSTPLSRWLRTFVGEYLNGLPLLETPQENVTLRWLTGAADNWCIAVNRNPTPATLRFNSRIKAKGVIFGEGQFQWRDARTIVFQPQQTVVLECER